jgi:GntR family transcriptional regulator, sialic acid-inducible nan operon repressor
MSTPIQRAEPIRRNKLYEQVVARIVDSIIAGEHPPGSLLPSEDELRAKFGVGRLAVREALLALERLGITSFVPGIGIQVVVPTPSQIVDKLDLGVLHYLSHTEGSHAQLREVRRSLEASLAGLAAERATEVDLARIDRALAQEQACIDDRTRYLAANREFHHAVAAAAHNLIFAALQTAVRRWIEAYPSTQVHVPGSDARSHGDHRKVAEAIVARDPAAAQQAMTEHLKVDYSLTGKLRRLRDR